MSTDTNEDNSLLAADEASILDGMDGPPQPPPGEIREDPWILQPPTMAALGQPPLATPPTALGDPSAAALWRERERRQRTVRLLMMFLLMLLLMDGEDGNNNNAPHKHGLRSRRDPRRKRDAGNRPLDSVVWDARTLQESRLREIARTHPRYQALIDKNKGENVEAGVWEWAQQLAEQERDEFGVEAAPASKPMLSPADTIVDEEATRKVWTYPWNVTGFYRGEWSRRIAKQADETTPAVSRPKVQDANATVAQERSLLDPVALEETLLETLQSRGIQAGVVLLPNELAVATRDDNNLTSIRWEQMTMDANGKMYKSVQATTEDQHTNNDKEGSPSITLTHNSGRAAFQIYARSIPAMKELSLVDGFVKLYDSTSPGYSTRKDILLRVRGVLIHAIGQLSLVSNVDVSRSAFVIMPSEARATQHRRLRTALEDLDGASLPQIRQDALDLYGGRLSTEDRDWALLSTPFGGRRLSSETSTPRNARAAMEEATEVDAETLPVSSNATHQQSESTLEPIRIPWSDVVVPYPFVRDDKEETVRRVRTPAARRMPPREQLLESNAASCEFEITMSIEPTEWTVGAWRALLSRHANEAKRLDPSKAGDITEDSPSGKENVSTPPMGPTNRRKILQDQALVMNMAGSIHSPNCDFTATLNVTAIRTDWEATTGKVINYSFYMMLVCMAQIILLLRQLLHSQAQSAAVRVSMLCIGWQAVIDALVCLVHIYFSLAMQPLFTAFASVAFFKLLIFCVIEMKYMSIIIQARNSSNGGQSTEVLRRQVAMLHLRFYLALFAAFLMLFYMGEKYRTFYVLGLYSFWVPQIILNIITEAKNPLHKYFINGMSLSRLVAPLYVFGVPNNFLKEIHADAPTDAWLCQLLVLWVGVQVAILHSQSKYGTRFMIPARFLPPKFDYSRPIPSSMLPPGALESPVPELALERNSENQPLVTSSPDTSSPARDRLRHTTAVTTRNRMRRTNRTESSGMTTETLDHSRCNSPLAPTLDCSICYDAINVRDQLGYMLAPCNHLFHRDCLIQWMDVKMECPICRTELPAL
jgi:hypothetical protein